jgi:hypothetical protein
MVDFPYESLAGWAAVNINPKIGQTHLGEDTLGPAAVAAPLRTIKPDRFARFVRRIGLP